MSPIRDRGAGYYTAGRWWRRQSDPLPPRPPGLNPVENPWHHPRSHDRSKQVYGG